MNLLYCNCYNESDHVSSTCKKDVHSHQLDHTAGASDYLYRISWDDRCCCFGCPEVFFGALVRVAFDQYHCYSRERDVDYHCPWVSGTTVGSRYRKPLHEALYGLHSRLPDCVVLRDRTQNWYLKARLHKIDYFGLWLGLIARDHLPFLLSSSYESFRAPPLASIE